MNVKQLFGSEPTRFELKELEAKIDSMLNDHGLERGTPEADAFVRDLIERIKKQDDD